VAGFVSTAPTTASPSRVVVRGVDGGCRRILIAKLQERGLDQGRAAALAESLLPMAVSFWRKALASHQANAVSGQDPEKPYAEAFSDLGQWAATLDLYAQS
jgi:hypothetical protein